MIGRGASYGSTSTSITAAVPGMPDTPINSVTLGIKSLFTIDHNSLLMMNSTRQAASTDEAVWGARRSHFFQRCSEKGTRLVTTRTKRLD